MPGPVRRIAPYPSRLIVVSPIVNWPEALASIEPMMENLMMENLKT
jgi:hypothetical protein